MSEFRSRIRRFLLATLSLGVSQLALALELDFGRVPSSRSFEVSFAAGDVTPDQTQVRVSSGTVTPPTLRNGRIVARVDPETTGRINVTVEVPSKKLKATRTALVLGFVNEDWNQPEPLSSPVNTPGWEDGAAVSADGQWLAIHYFPVLFDCITSGKPDSKFCQNASGPVTAPERPDMPGANRVGKGHIKNGCPSVGVDSLPFPVPPTSLYLFKRQADGGFGDPHPVYWDGVDGCVTPYGPALINEGANDLTMLFGFDSPSDSGGADTHGDLFAIRLDPRKARAVGRTESREGKLADVDQQGARVGRLSKAHTANPEGWVRPDGSHVVFYDDENSRDDLFYAESSKGWMDGDWGEEHKIPEPVSTPDVEESQPFFDGKALYFRRDTTLFRSQYKGGSMSESAAWSKPEKVLDGDRKSHEPGEIFGTGEPTIATVNGHRELYFVYAERTPDGSLNFDVGRVTERSNDPAAAVPAAPPPTAIELPIRNLKGIEGSRASAMQTGVAGAAGGKALVWDYSVKRNAGALLLMQQPEMPSNTDEITLSAMASEDTTLGLMVGERGGARYAVQFPWPGGKWQTRTFKWSEFQFQESGSKDGSGKLEPDQVEALLIIDASGYLGKSGDRTLQVDRLTLGLPH